MNYKMIPLDQYMNLVKFGRIPHKRNSLVLLEDEPELMVYGVTLDNGKCLFDSIRQGGTINKTITHVLVNEVDMPKITISKELLVKAGYKCWNKNPDETGEWQKCIRDADGGKKYFINIKERLGFNGEKSIRNWWPSIQFNVKFGDTTESIEVNLIQWFNNSGEWSGITIEQMEEFCESVWTRLEGQYYEK